MGRFRIKNHIYTTEHNSTAEFYANSPYSVEGKANAGSIPAVPIDIQKGRPQQTRRMYGEPHRGKMLKAKVSVCASVETSPDETFNGYQEWSCFSGRFTNDPLLIA